MKMKLDIVGNSYSYSIYLVPGLLAWTSFSTVIMRLNNSLLEKSHLIKKINVPPFIYQISIFITEFCVLVFSYLLALIFLLLVNHSITFTFLYLLPLLLLQTIFAFSIGVILSLFTPFYRDLKEAVPIVLQLWFWMTPIIYMAQMVADKYPALLTYNPFYYYVRVYQDIFLYSKAPALSEMLLLAFITFIPFLVTVILYKKMIGHIKDII